MKMPESLVHNMQNVVVREEKSFVSGDAYKSINTFFQTPIYQAVQKANAVYRGEAWSCPTYTRMLTMALNLSTHGENQTKMVII